MRVAVTRPVDEAGRLGKWAGPSVGGALRNGGECSAPITRSERGRPQREMLPRVIDIMVTHIRSTFPVADFHPTPLLNPFTRANLGLWFMGREGSPFEEMK